jgi:hypothetical protein
MFFIISYQNMLILREFGFECIQAKVHRVHVFNDLPNEVAMGPMGPMGDGWGWMG